MTVQLRHDLNTTVLFDLRKMKWINLVRELSLWCDETRIASESDAWNAEKFGFGKEAIDKLPELRARRNRNECPNEVNKFLFYAADQPLQPNEWFDDNKNRKEKIIDSHSYSPRMEHKYSNERVPVWRDDFEFLHKSSNYFGLP